MLEGEQAAVTPVTVEAAGFTVTVADADRVVSATDVAVTVAVVVAVTDGALYMIVLPLPESVPVEVFHVTAVFEDPVTVAVNCCVPPDKTVAVVGTMDTTTDCGAVTVIAAVPDFVASSLLTAFTVAVPAEVAAVKVPSEAMEPEPLATDHVTAALKLPVPVTVAEHREVWLSCIEVGEHETLTDEIVAGFCPPPPLFPPPPPQPRAKIESTHTPVNTKVRRHMNRIGRSSALDQHCYSVRGNGMTRLHKMQSI